MKVILLEDVKGKGKKDEIKDFPNGFGNFLVAQKKAVLANEENLNKLKQDLAKRAELEAVHILEMKELKSIIESEPITMKAKIGSNGKMFGSISTTKVAEYVNETLLKNKSFKFDKKKIEGSENITCLGIYEYKVKLHQTVIAKLTIKVVEE